MKPIRHQTDEKTARRTSLFITGLLLVFFAIVAYVWVIFRGTIPPEDENPYIVVGQFEFGQGLPSGGRAPAQPVESPPRRVEEPVITSAVPAPVQAPTQPSPAPSHEESEDDEEVESFTQGQSDASSESDLSASMFEFGQGEEGLQNRKLLHYVLPRYTVQREGRVKYELYILPDGRVERVRALTVGAAPELKRAGEEAILQWRFSPIASQQVQRVTVTIRFRLR